jgi:hypothetical protein
LALKEVVLDRDENVLDRIHVAPSPKRAEDYRLPDTPNLSCAKVVTITLPRGDVGFYLTAVRYRAIKRNWKRHGPRLLVRLPHLDADDFPAIPITAVLGLVEQRARYCKGH